MYSFSLLKGEVFEGKKFLREFTLTLTLSRRGRGKRKESRERKEM